MSTTATKMTALEFINSIDHPILWYVSNGIPTGTTLAVCNQYYDVPLNGYEDAEGTVTDGGWQWDGQGNVTDANHNTVTNLRISEDAAEWQRQIDEYESEC